MKIYGKNRRGTPQRNTKPRKANRAGGSFTNQEKRLQKRIEGYNALIRDLRPNDGAYHRPGSLQKS